jgi:hypothetical protein
MKIEMNHYGLDGLSHASRHFNPAHGPDAAGEGAGFDLQALQERDVEIGERIVFLAIESQMLPVLETAAG